VKSHPNPLYRARGRLGCVAGPEAEDPSADLLRRWQEGGDEDALNRLLQREVGLLKQMVHGRVVGGLSGAASTSDVAQEAVLGLLQVKRTPAFADPVALRAYLWRSAWHLLVKRYAQKEKVPESLEGDPALDRVLRHAPALANVERSERAMAIGLAMGVLSHEDRELIRQVYFEGKDVGEAARPLGLARGAASMRLVRARRLLAERLAEWAEIIG
jgi:RNA polymerase sigma factor (sigma-70 family)